MKTDTQIARETKLEKIREVAARVGFPEDDVYNYGRYIAKVSNRLIDDEKVAKHKLILVTAITATKAGVEEGIVPGGGTALIRVAKVLDSIKPADDDELAGVNIIRRALEEPLRQIAANAGFEGSVVVEKVREGKDGFGFNAASGEYEDLMAAGIIDPKQVSRFALQHASSVAALLLTTECAIAELPKPEPAAPAAPMGGGMGGMY